MNRFAIDVYDGVLDGGILRLEVKIDTPEGLFRVVAEKRMLDEAVYVLVCQTRGLLLVEGIHSLNSGINLVGIRPMPICGENDDPGNLLLGNELKDLLAFAINPVPCVLRARFHLRGNWNVGAEYGEDGRLLKGLL